MQLGQLLQPHAVHFIGRMAGGGAGAQAPGVPFIPARARPQTGGIAGAGALGLEFGQLPFQRGGDRAGRDGFRAALPLTGDSGGTAHQRLHDVTPGAGIGQGVLHLPDRLVEQERGRDRTDPPGTGQPFQLSIQLAGHCGQPRQIGFRIGSIADRVIPVEKARRIEIGADILDHDIGRVAPAADRDIAIGQGKAIQCHAECALDHGQAGARGVIQRGRIDALHLRQPLAQQRDDGALPGG